MDITKLKVGDCIMYNRGGVAYVTFGIVDVIEKRAMEFGKEKIILHLKHTYKRHRLTNDGTMNEDVFTYDYRDNLYITPDCRETMSEKIYKITKAEYNAVEKAVRAFIKVREKSCGVLSNMYFEQKRKERK